MSADKSPGSVTLAELQRILRERSGILQVDASPCGYTAHLKIEDGSTESFEGADFCDAVDGVFRVFDIDITESEEP